MEQAKQQLLTRYLLGELPAQSREDLEKEYLVNDEAFEVLSALEIDLIDSYVRGKLAPKDKDQFEQYFLRLPQRRERVDAAKQLLFAAANADAMAPVRPATGPIWLPSKLGAFLRGNHPAFALVPAAALLVIGFVSILLAIQNARLRNELARLHQPAFNLQMAGLQPEPLSTVSLLLRAGTARQGEFEKSNHAVSLARNTDAIIFLLDLRRNEYSRYEVTIRTVEGEEVIRLSGLTSQSTKYGGKAVPVLLSSRLFPSGAYVITVFGKSNHGNLQLVDNYNLSVAK